MTRALLRALAGVWRHSPVRFIAVGLSNTAVGLGAVFVCWRVFGWSDVTSNVTGYCVGLAWAFTWHRRITFQADTAVVHGFVRFVAVCLAAYATNLEVVLLARAWLGPRSFVPHVLGNVVYSTLVFVGCRWFVFRPSADRSQPPASHGA